MNALNVRNSCTGNLLHVCPLQGDSMVLKNLFVVTTYWTSAVCGLHD